MYIFLLLRVSVCVCRELAITDSLFLRDELLFRWPLGDVEVVLLGATDALATIAPLEDWLLLLARLSASWVSAEE